MTRGIKLRLFIIAALLTLLMLLAETKMDFIYAGF